MSYPSISYRLLLLAMAAAGMVGLGSPARAEPPTVPVVAAAYQQVPDAYRFPLGKLEVVALSDGTVPQDLHQLLTRTTPADIDHLLGRSFLANPVEASINAFLIRDNTRRILVDTGSGQLFGPGYGGKLVDSLGVRSPILSIDDVLALQHEDSLVGHLDPESLRHDRSI